MKRLLALALAVLLLAAAGCSTFFDTAVYLEEPYEAPSDNTGAEDAADTISSYASLRRAILGLVSERVESALLQFQNYDGTISRDISTAWWEVKSSTALGAFAVDYISYDLSRIVSYTQAEIYIAYKRSAYQMARLEELSNLNALRTRVREAMQNGESYLALRLTSAALTTDSVRQTVEEAYYGDPLSCPVLPQTDISLYPDTGVDRIVEVQLDYGMDADALQTRREELQEALQSLLLAAFPPAEGETEPGEGAADQPEPAAEQQEPDAAPGAEDAEPQEPDAAPGAEDAEGPEPDTAPGAEDLNQPEPDAEQADSGIAEGDGPAEASEEPGEAAAARLRAVCESIAGLCVWDGTAGGTAWEALTQGTSGSEGMAMALEAACRVLGIGCRVIFGRLDGESHAWNLVEPDGFCYHVDISRGDEEREMIFLLGDEDLWGLYWWDSSQYPACPAAFGETREEETLPAETDGTEELEETGETEAAEEADEPEETGEAEDAGGTASGEP